MKPVTERQISVLNAYMELTAELGLTPNLRQLRERTGYKHVASVHKHMEALTHKGYVQKVEVGSSGYPILKDSQRRPVRLAYMVDESV